VKKKQSNTSSPRRKRLSRSSRLAAAKTWIPTYNGKNLLRGYRKYFGVDFVCAIKELEILGYETNSEYIKQLQQSADGRRRAKEIKGRTLLETSDCSDENFYYIIGYTSGGASFGITYEEMEMEIEIEEKGADYTG